MLSDLTGASLVFARPQAFALAFLLVPVVLLYFLRMRFSRRAVGSTFIWRLLAQSIMGGESLRRRSVLLLLLQMAAILAAAVAAAGPSLVTLSLRKPPVAIVIDVSASMATRDCAPLDAGGSGKTSRVDAAVRAASEEIEGLESDVPIAVFACAETARALLRQPVADKAAAIAALRGLAAAASAFDEDACADSLSAVLARTEGTWSAIVFTDGGLSLGGEALAEAFRGFVRFRILGRTGANLGVAGLALTTSEKGGRKAAFSLWNGGQAREAVVVRLKRNGESVAEGRISPSRGWSRSELEATGAAEDGVYTIEIEGSRSRTLSAPGGICYLSVARKRTLSALLVGRKNPFLEAALAHEGVSYARAEDLGDYAAHGNGGERRGLGIDLVVSDSAAWPQEAPAPAYRQESASRTSGPLRAGLVVFGAPPPGSPVSIEGRTSGTIAAAPASLSHPLVRFIDWEGARTQSSLTYSVSGNAVVLAAIEGKPVLVAWERGGYRCMACGIDLSRSDLGLKSAFPILLQNYFQWYGPRTDGQSRYTLIAGERVRRLEDESFKVSGDSVATERYGPDLFLTPSEAGIFRWTSGGEEGYLAVNVPPSELDIAPRPLAPVWATRSGASAQPAEVDAVSSGVAAAVPLESSRNFGGFVSALLSCLLMIEWALWYRGSKRSVRRKLSGSTEKNSFTARASHET
jgi:hypothetical protein